MLFRSSVPFASFTRGNDYTVFINVNSDAQGRLVLSGSPTDDPFVILNGFQLTPVTAVPEPSALSLLAVGLGGVIALRRVRRRTD